MDLARNGRRAGGDPMGAQGRTDEVSVVLREGQGLVEVGCVGNVGDGCWQTHDIQLYLSAKQWRHKGMRVEL